MKSFKVYDKTNKYIALAIVVEGDVVGATTSYSGFHYFTLDT